MKRILLSVVFCLSMLSVLFVAPSTTKTTAYAEQTNAISTVYVASDGSDTNAGEFDTPFKTLQKAYDALGGIGTIRIISDITADATLNITEGKDILIGSYSTTEIRQIKRITNTGNMFTVASGARLTFENIIIDGNKANIVGDSIVKNAGTTTLNAGTIMQNNTAENGGAILLQMGAVLTINGGEILNNSAINGGAIHSTGAIINQNGGIIKSNVAQTAGGGVYAQSNTNYTLNSGEIKNNHSTVNGGGIYLSTSTLSLKSPNITANAAALGAGVYTTMNSSVLFDGSSVSPNPIITGNANTETAGNFYICDDEEITLTGTVGPSANVGILYAGEAGEKFFLTDNVLTETDLNTHFKYDNDQCVFNFTTTGISKYYSISGTLIQQNAVDYNGKSLVANEHFDVTITKLFGNENVTASFDVTNTNIDKVQCSYLFLPKEAEKQNYGEYDWAQATTGLPKNVGKYVVKMTTVKNNNIYFASAEIYGEVEIVKTNIEITVLNQTMIYGTQNFSLSQTAWQVKNGNVFAGDNLGIQLKVNNSTAVDKNMALGEYDIVATSNNANYEIVFSGETKGNGILTVVGNQIQLDVNGKTEIMLKGAFSNDSYILKTDVDAETITYYYPLTGNQKVLSMVDVMMVKDNKQQMVGNDIWVTMLLPGGVNKDSLVIVQIDEGKVKEFKGESLQFSEDGKSVTFHTDGLGMFAFISKVTNLLWLWITIPTVVVLAGGTIFLLWFLKKKNPNLFVKKNKPPKEKSEPPASRPEPLQ